MSKEKVLFEPLPGDFAWITSGGTRTTIKLSRPWQKPLGEIVNPRTCPFETKPQEPIELDGMPFGWKLLPNPWTPHLQHRLVVPDACWPPAQLQELGGPSNIKAALEVVRLATARANFEITAFIHVGQFAGQNLGHPHWHLHELRGRKFLDPATVKIDPQCIVRETTGFVTIAGGARCGECLILPREEMVFDEASIPLLTEEIFWIIQRGNLKFLSQEWLEPQFVLTVRVSADRHIRYADYCPILAVWGGPELVTAPLEGAPITLPWPHDVTASYLRQ